MADFSLAQIGGASGGAPSPQGGVEQPSAFAATTEFISGAAKSLFEGAADASKAEAEQQANNAVTRFSAQQMQFADWVDRGELTSQEARMRMRNNLIQASADNVNLAEAFRKTHESIIETAGMGKVAATGTEQEQQLFKVTQEARDNGFITPGMTPEQEKERTYDWMELQQARLKRSLAQEELAFQSAQVSLQRGRTGLAADQQALRTARMEASIATATIEGSRAYLPVFSQRVQETVQAAQSGELTPVQADLQMRQLLDQVQGEFRQGGATMREATLNNLLAPYERMVETASGAMTGRFGTEVMNEMAANAVASTELMILADDSTRSLVATSSLLGSAAGPLLQVHGGEATRNALQIYQKGDREDGTPANPWAEGQEGVRAWRDIIDNGMTRVNRGEVGNPTQQQDSSELGRQINSMLRSTGRYAEGEEFSAVRPTLDMIASDQYAKYITGNGRGVVSQENEAAVQSYTQSLFLDDVQPLIEEEWRNATTRLSGERFGPGPQGMTEEAATSQVIRPMFTGDGVRFVKSSQAGENPRIDEEVRRLNERVSPALNMFIRVGAHLEEHTDYERIYESNYAEIFGNPGTGSAESE